MKKKLSLNLGNINEMMSREQMRTVIGGSGCDYGNPCAGTCADGSACRVPPACNKCSCGDKPC
ncbi:TIGR04149 family rSAM-modified RiPP [Chitinophaga flava]|uniref:Uncharacterized protein n=1 Tax=Chitinophaga flava TaxID=2259036 RepID=A0A365XSV9_9BACT|nr:hypothetical protein DF182_23365 [Chitinophaga flava]